MTLSADWLMQAALRTTLLLAGLFLLWRFLPAAHPALRRNVLLWITAGVLIAPWLSGWWSVSGSPASTNDASTTPDQTQGVAWATLATALWLSGTSLAAIRLGIQAWSLQRLIHRARPWCGPPALTNLTVLQSPAISGPCVAGGRKPVLLLPDSAHHWTPAQWQMVLAHETQHLQQQDLRLAWLPRLVLCLYWWHPLAHWLTRQFHAESEALCDRAVLARSGHGLREYIEFLLSLNAERQPAHAAGMALKSPLGKRIQRIFPAPGNPRLRWTAAASLLILTGIALFSFSLKTVPRSNLHEGPSVATDTAETMAPDPDAEETALRLSANPFPEN